VYTSYTGWTGSHEKAVGVLIVHWVMAVHVVRSQSASITAGAIVVTIEDDGVEAGRGPLHRCCCRRCGMAAMYPTGYVSQKEQVEQQTSGLCSCLRGAVSSSLMPATSPSVMYSSQGGRNGVGSRHCALGAAFILGRFRSLPHASSPYDAT